MLAFLFQSTPSGFTFDQAIQTGVDNPGHPFISTVGVVAGDEESYSVFADIFDPIIEERHNGYKKTDMHKTDLDASKIQGKYSRQSARDRRLNIFFSLRTLYISYLDHRKSVTGSTSYTRLFILLAYYTINFLKLFVF